MNECTPRNGGVLGRPQVLDPVAFGIRLCWEGFTSLKPQSKSSVYSSPSYIQQDAGDNSNTYATLSSAPYILHW